MKDYQDKYKLETAYRELNSLNKVAEYFGISKKLVLNYMKRFNIPRNKRQKKIKQPDTYHRGYITTWNGYKKVKAPLDHPGQDKKGYVMEHRLIVEEHLGRYLTDEEEVHHINHNKQDNRISNLQVLTKKEHRRIHLIDSIHKVKI